MVRGLFEWRALFLRGVAGVEGEDYMEFAWRVYADGRTRKGDALIVWSSVEVGERMSNAVGRAGESLLVARVLIL